MGCKQHLPKKLKQELAIYTIATFSYTKLQTYLCAHTFNTRSLTLFGNPSPNHSFDHKVRYHVNYLDLHSQHALP